MQEAQWIKTLVQPNDQANIVFNILTQPLCKGDQVNIAFFYLVGDTNNPEQTPFKTESLGVYDGRKAISVPPPASCKLFLILYTGPTTFSAEDYADAQNNQVARSFKAGEFNLDAKPCEKVV